MDAETMWGGIGVICVIVLLALILTATFSEHHVEKYYVGETGRIKADVPWAVDITVCGDGIGIWEQYQIVDSAKNVQTQIGKVWLKKSHVPMRASFLAS